MGHVILERLVRDAGLEDRVTVSSSGMGEWHVGEHADPRTVAILAAHGYDGSRHQARGFDADEFAGLDLVLASDEGHVRALERLATTPADRAKIRLVREFDPEAVAAGTLQTADPWFGDESSFLQCYQEVEAACRGILDHIREQLETDRARPNA